MDYIDHSNNVFFAFFFFLKDCSCKPNPYYTGWIKLQQKNEFKLHNQSCFLLFIGSSLFVSARHRQQRRKNERETARYVCLQSLRKTYFSACLFPGREGRLLTVYQVYSYLLATKLTLLVNLVLKAKKYWVTSIGCPMRETWESCVFIFSATFDKSIWFSANGFCSLNFLF